MSNPTTKVAPFNGSLDGLTGVDPIRYNGGLWLEEATSNYCVDPIPTNATYWSAGGSASQSVSGGWLKHAAGSTSGTTMSIATATAPASVAGDIWTVTVTLRREVGTAYNLALRAQFFSAASGGGSSLGTQVSPTLTVTPGASGDRVSYTFPAAPASTASVVFVVLRLGGTLASGDEFWSQKWQIEKKSYATSYADYLLGSGYGGSVGNASTRAASSAALDPTVILDPTSGAIAFRVTPTIETGLEEIWGECGVKGSSTDHVQWGRDASTHPFVEWSANNAAYQRLTGTETLAAGTECLFYTDWDGTAIRLSIDNGTIQTDTRDAVSDSWGAGDLVLKAE